MGERMLTIRRLADKAGVSSKTLRLWEHRELLPSPRRTHTNYRVYAEDDLERVIFIRKAQSLGLTLAEIRQVFDLARSRTAPCAAVIQWAGKKARVLEEQIRMLRELRARLERYRRRWLAEKIPARLGPNEVCRCIASVSMPDRPATPSPLPRRGGEHDGGKADSKPMSGLRRLSGRRGL